MTGQRETTAIGRVVSFDEKNGVGFIRTRRLPEDVFVYASAVAGGRPLRVGQRVRFHAEASDRGLRAVQVQPIRRWPFGDRSDWWTLAVLMLALVTVAMTTRVGIGWRWPTSWLVAANMLTAVGFLWDKRQAVLGCRRIPEILLLFLATLGGTPAAVLALVLLGHKTHRGTFSTILGSVVAAQLVLLGGAWWYLSRQ
jgi:uncharacterized membrane protein YsdA (DUF1294 family)/cold shock CspA family protein